MNNPNELMKLLGLTAIGCGFFAAILSNIYVGIVAIVGILSALGVGYVYKVAVASIVENHPDNPFKNQEEETEEFNPED